MFFGAVSLVALALASSAVCDDGVPVVVWGTSVDSEGPEAGSPFGGADLSRSIRSLLGRHAFAVVFVEETLSVEDFGRRDAEGASPFPHLRRRMAEPHRYLPSASGPAETLERIGASEGAVDRVEMTDEGLSADIPPGPGRFLIIGLKDAREDEDRLKMLARHDRFAHEMYEKLKRKHRDVIAVYTARRPSWEVSPEPEADNPSDRVRRHLLQAEPEPQDFDFYNLTDRAYLYSKTMTLFVDGETHNLHGGVASLGNSSANEIVFDLKFGNATVQFTYLLDRGYWYMEKATVTKIDGATHDLRAADVGAPVGFSYHCGQTIDYVSANASKDAARLRLTDFQAQPFFAPYPSQGRFMSHYDCVGVMTVPIWSGLFLLFILFIIISVGITMMMDIRTMDRFDDPKGKTITIIASE